jgi:hypothetical protein
MRFLRLGIALFAGSLLIGCASTSSSQRPDRDAVLQQYRSAADHLRRAEFNSARPPLDDALLTLGGITAGDRSARQARGYFRSESTKSFRGEPYERVMAYFYRGILYWMQGEPDNARACFRNAQIQDSDAEQGEYQADYALLDYLDGYITTRLGGGGEDSLRRARAAARLGSLPDYDVTANVLVFFEMGRGPSKYASGEYGEQLRFRPGTSRSSSLRLQIAGQSVNVPPADDLTFQATTRGGRVMDHVLANKAVFKGSTDTFGNAAIVSGAILAGTSGRRSSADEIGAGLLVAGLLSKVISAATTPSADTRTWDNLPNLIGFTSLRVPPGEHRLVADFLDPAGHVVLSRDVTLSIVPGTRETVLFFSDRP